MATKKLPKKPRISSSRLDASAHMTPFEVHLDHFLKERCPASNITVADMKDIIWNGQDTNLVSRIAFTMAEQNKKMKFEDILQEVNDAWNNFPHMKLNGLAPRDMVERFSRDKDFSRDAPRPDFYALFADRFPKSANIVRQRDNDWAWEYPAAFNSRRTGLATIREEAETATYDDDDEVSAEAKDTVYEIGILFAQACLEAEPLQFEAAIILARDAFEEDESRLAMQILESTISEGRKMFPGEFSLGTDHLPWAFVDNRAFLLLLGEYATLIESMHGPQRAIPLYEEIIALNPNDNQGIRGFLATAYIKTNRLEDLLRLDEKFPEDLLAELSAGTLLALYKLGRLDEARARIKATKKHFKRIFREILKTDHQQPELTPGRVRVGGDDEAWFYWQNQGTFWVATRGAREFLRSEISDAQ